MRALLLRQHGGLENLECVTDYPKPTVKDDHVVIKVGASSFNYHDVFTVKGMPGIKVPLPVVIGLDMAGEIVEIGANVIGWKSGDRVLVNPLNKTKGLMGEMLDGGMAATTTTYVTSDPLSYCRALSALYRRNVANGNADSQAGGALAECEAGRTDKGIPMLERILTDSQIPLPQRGY